MQAKTDKGHKSGIMFSGTALTFYAEGKNVGCNSSLFGCLPPTFFYPLFSECNIQAIHYFPANTLYTYLMPVNVLSLILYVKYT